MYRVNTIFVLNRQKEIIDVIPSQGDSCFFDDEYELDLETFMDTYTSVSYTHLTLPTNSRV